MFKLFICLALLIQGVAYGQVTRVDQVSRVGIVDSERIFKESKMAKEYQKKLQEDFGKREKILIDEASKIKAESASLSSNKSKLTATDKVKKGRELAERDRQWQIKNAEFSEDLKQRRLEDRSKIAQKANAALDSVAQRKNIDLILQEFAYSSKAIDLTDDVINTLNRMK